jgi:hypothetical protein
MVEVEVKTGGLLEFVSDNACTFKANGGAGRDCGTPETVQTRPQHKPQGDTVGESDGTA